MKLPIFLIAIFVNLSCDTNAQKMTPEQYLQTGRHIWKTYVPKSGQAETVQGELLRAIEKLADEAQRNGNINFNANCHSMFISFLKKYLINEKLFDKATIEQIKTDLDTISIADEPCLEEDVYDRLRERIVDWYLQNKTPIANTRNPELYC